MPLTCGDIQGMGSSCGKRLPSQKQGNGLEAARYSVDMFLFLSHRVHLRGKQGKPLPPFLVSVGNLKDFRREFQAFTLQNWVLG